MCSTLETDDAFRVLELRGHTDAVRSVAWSPCGRHIATGSWDKTVRVWLAATGKQVRALRGYVSWSRWLLRGSCVMTSVAWSPCGTYIVAGATDGTPTVFVWHASTGKQLRKLDGHTDDINSVAWSPCGKYIATGSADKTACVWCASTGRRLHVLRGHNASVDRIAWSPPAAAPPEEPAFLRLATTSSNDMTVRVWNAVTGNEVKMPHHASDGVNSVLWWFYSSNEATSPLVAQSPCSRFLAFAIVRSAYVLTSQQRIYELCIPTSVISIVVWSPCSTRVITGSWDGDVHIWTVCRWTPRTHRCFTPAARQLALRVMCAHNRLAACASTAAPKLPIEILLLVLEIMFQD